MIVILNKFWYLKTCIRVSTLYRQIFELLLSKQNDLTSEELLLKYHCYMLPVKRLFPSIPYKGKRANIWVIYGYKLMGNFYVLKHLVNYLCFVRFPVYVYLGNFIPNCMPITEKYHYSSSDVACKKKVELIFAYL